MRLTGDGCPVSWSMMLSETSLALEEVDEGNSTTFPGEMDTTVVPSKPELPVPPKLVESSLGSGLSQSGTMEGSHTLSLDPNPVGRHWLPPPVDLASN